MKLLHIGQHVNNSESHVLFPGITMEEKRKRKKMNTVTTGFNLAVWILDLFAMLFMILPMVTCMRNN